MNVWEFFSFPSYLKILFYVKVKSTEYGFPGTMRPFKKYVTLLWNFSDPHPHV